jgi:hypothetical protein
VSGYLPWHVLIGVAWWLVTFHYNFMVRQIREQAGDAWALLILSPLVLLWPVEAIGMTIYLLTGLYRIIVPVKAEFGLVCQTCHSVHRWLGSREAMEDIGWKMVRDAGDPSHVYWFCPNCDPWEAQ